MRDALYLVKIPLSDVFPPNRGRRRFLRDQETWKVLHSAMNKARGAKEDPSRAEPEWEEIDAEALGPLDQILGEGAFGTGNFSHAQALLDRVPVYKAHWSGYNVAVKKVKRPWNEQAMKVFTNELEWLAVLQSPYLVSSSLLHFHGLTRI